jgi:hypothetical protein
LDISFAAYNTHPFGFGGKFIADECFAGLFSVAAFSRDTPTVAAP